MCQMVCRFAKAAMSGEWRDQTSELSAMVSANMTQSRVAQHESPGMSRMRTCGRARQLPQPTRSLPPQTLQRSAAGAPTGLTSVPVVAKTRSALVMSLLCGMTESASSEQRVTMTKSAAQRYHS